MDDYSHATEMPHVSNTGPDIATAITIIATTVTAVAVSEADFVGPSAKPEGYL